MYVHNTMYKNVIQGWWENLIKLPILSATYIDFHGTVSDLFLYNSHSAIDELCKLTVCMN